MITAAGISAGANLLGSIGSLFGKKGQSSAKAVEQQYNYNLALQKQAQEWQKYMYQNRYQMQVEDLEAAGINKLYGLGSAPTTASGTNSVGMPEYVNEKTAKMQQFLQGIQMAQDWSAKKAQISKIEAETRTENINTLVKIQEEAGTKLDNILKKKNINWFDKIQAANLRKTIAETEYNIAGAINQKEQAGTARAQAGKIREETAPISRTNKWYGRHPILGGFFTGIEEGKTTLQAIGAVAGGVYGANKISKLKGGLSKAMRAGTARKAVRGRVTR